MSLFGCTELFLSNKNVFRCGAKHIFKFLHRCVLMLIFGICVRCFYQISDQLNFHCFPKTPVENIPYRGSRVFSFSIASVFRETSCIYLCLSGMIFGFDRGHVAHKGSHNHFNSQVFVIKADEPLMQFVVPHLSLPMQKKGVRVT